MSKILSALVVFIFLFSIIPVNVLYAEAQTSNVCCLKNLNGDYCSYTSADNCDLSFDPEGKLPFKQSSFACSQIDECSKPVCCINAEGTCSEKVSKAQCIGQGGTLTSSESCSSVVQCQQVACIINGQCSFPMTQEECTRAGEEFNTPVIIDTEVTSLEQCNEKNSLQEGCCVTTPSCGRKTSSECSQVGGEFKPGILCSNPDLAGVCPGIKKEASKQCVVEDVYWFDSKGNRENAVGINYDGFIHDSEADKTNKEGNCDYASGTICGEDNRGQNACIDINCNVGDTFVANGFVQYSFETGTSTPERVTIANEDLGGRDIRYNGESWCMTNTETSPNAPGTIHYIYLCKAGKIDVNPLGTYRNTICESQIKERVIDEKNVDYETAKRVNNLWDQCSKCGDSSFNKCGKRECLKLGGSTDPEKSHCVYDKDGIDECWPKYPPGIDFTGDIGGIPNSKHTFENTCGICGDGTNSCDRKECSYLGDCGNFKEGLSTLEGIGTGGFFGGLAAAGIYYVGPGFVKEALSLGVFKSTGGAIAAGTEVSLGGAGKFVAKELAKTVAFYEVGEVLGEINGKQVIKDRDEYYMIGKDAQGKEIAYTAEKQ